MLEYDHIKHEWIRTAKGRKCTLRPSERLPIVVKAPVLIWKNGLYYRCTWCHRPLNGYPIDACMRCAKKVIRRVNFIKWYWRELRGLNTLNAS